MKSLGAYSKEYSNHSNVMLVRIFKEIAVWAGGKANHAYCADCDEACYWSPFDIDPGVLLLV